MALPIIAQKFPLVNPFHEKTPDPPFRQVGSFLSASPQLIFQPQIIRNHGNKLAIRGLSAVVLNGIAKIGIERIHVAAIPSDLDGVADGKKSIGLFIGLNTLDLLCCLILAHRNLSVKRQTYRRRRRLRLLRQRRAAVQRG